MSGIQFFEARIDDQLLPAQRLRRPAPRHGFEELGSFSITPLHAVTYART